MQAMPKRDKKQNRHNIGSKQVFLVYVLLLSFLVFLPYPVFAQGEITIQIEQINPYADFTVDDSITISISGTFTSESYAGIVYFGIYSPDGWVSSISPEEALMAPDETISFEGEITPEIDAAEEEHDIYVWASIEKQNPSERDIISSTSDVFSSISIIEVIKNRVKMISEMHEDPVLPSSTIKNIFTVTNAGTVPDLFFIDLIDDERLKNEGWVVTQSANNLTLNPGETKEFIVEQQVPEDVKVGDYEFHVVVSSEGHAASKSSQTLTTKVRIPKIEEPFNFLPFLFIAFVGIGISLGAFFAATEIGYLALLSLFLPLYVRLKKKDVLSHFTRGHNAIIQYLDLHNGVGAYHLKVLEREGYIKSIRDGIYKRFYPRNMRIPEKRLHLSRIQRDVLSEIQKHPGVTQKQIAKLLDESKQVINYNVKILENASLIRVERYGRETACFAAHVRYVPDEDVYEVTEDTGAAHVMKM
jgi:DNA-binding transcriptional ArsR family regulator